MAGAIRKGCGIRRRSKVARTGEFVDFYGRLPLAVLGFAGLGSGIELQSTAGFELGAINSAVSFGRKDMQIIRSGSSANHGRSSISFKSPNFGWNESDSTITIKQRRVRDFSTTANHDYVVSLPPEELTQILAAVAGAALSNPSLFEERMGSALKSVAQLHAVLSGVVRT